MKRFLACDEHGKTISPSMGKLLSRKRVGRPQIFAGLLLLVFIAQCGWLIAHIPVGAVSSDELARLEQGLAQWHGNGIASTNTAFGQMAPSADLRGGRNEYDRIHSPLWYLIESAPLAIFRADPASAAGIWLSRAPYVFIGALLGASLWYVSRRLYGNAGGYIALSLYCFSPAVIRTSALWLAEPDIAGGWGTFGAVFTAIAVSHTLYAPREVVLWNWRRILLLGISLVLAVGTQFSLAVIIPVLLLFMLYVAAERKTAVLAILLCAIAVGVLLLLSSYSFHFRIFATSLAHAQWIDVSAQSLALPQAWMLVGKEILASSPVLVVLGPAALIAYLGWPRTRYFGNTAPLGVAILFILLRAGSPHATGSVFGLIAAVFIFVFVAGIAADFLETRFRDMAAAVLIGLLAANAVWNLLGLARIG